jgi:hypothetical protein
MWAAAGIGKPLNGLCASGAGKGPILRIQPQPASAHHCDRRLVALGMRRDFSWCVAHRPFQQPSWNIDAELVAPTDPTKLLALR